MAKKYRAQHITVFAVYKKFTIFGEHGRSFEIAMPDLKDAEKWIDDKIEEGAKPTSFLPEHREDYMIEEMPAIMKAWQP